MRRLALSAGSARFAAGGLVVAFQATGTDLEAVECGMQQQNKQKQLTHAEKVQCFLTEMTQRRVSLSDAAPPFFRFAWSRGSELEPPWFMSFGKAWLTTGAVWGVLFMVAFLGPLFLLPLPLSLEQRLKLVLLVASGGVLFGFLMACYFQWRKKTLGLPDWKDYPQSDSEES